MEISPVASVRLAPMVRSKATDLGLTDIYEIEHSTRSRDETYTPHTSKAASGIEDDEYNFDEADEEGAPHSGPIKINYFV